MAGVSLNDRKLAAEVRTLSLRKIKKVLESEPEDAEGKRFQEQILLRLAPTILPRLNEHTGEDGNELVLVISGETAARYGRTTTPPHTKAGSS